MIDEVRATFAALREVGGPGPSALTVRSPDVGPQGVLLGMDDEMRPHLLIPAAEPPPESPVAAVSLGLRPLTVAAVAPATYLDVTCLTTALAEVFDHLIVAIFDRLTAAPDAPSRAVAAVLEEWRRLLVDPGPGPSRDRLVSIFGELLVMLDVVRADPSHRIDAWVGPHKGRHDVRRGSDAVEVKTTRTHTARVVTIHGEDQLLEPEAGSLHLHLVRLEEVPGSGRSVPNLVDELIASGASAHAVYESVEAAGLAPADYPAAGRLRLDVRERLTVPVDDATPRIIPTSFAGGARPAGVIDLTYRVDLDHCLERTLSEESYGELVARLAGGPA